MIELNVETISRETVKPDIPPPPHFRSTPLSQLDQIAPPIYTHLLLFYSATAPQAPSILKQSLSQTLTLFHPLAGSIQLQPRLRTLHAVSSDDDGVEFIQARCASDLRSLLHDHRHPPVIDEFIHLLPIKSSTLTHRDPLLAVQLTAFANGGSAIGLSVSHFIADGASIAAFLAHWSHAARRDREPPPPPPRFDSAAVFPPQTLPQPDRESPPPPPPPPAGRASVKRFVVSAAAIERLREGGHTRVEAVAGMVWRCLVRAQGESAAAATEHVVDLRRRMPGRLSAETFGNLWVRVAAAGGGGGGGEEAALRAAVRGVDGEDGRRYADGGGGAGCRWIFSSWCRMPFYGSDFGWGPPCWVACGIWDMKDVCILMDAKDGVGIEVWLWMEREEMEKVENDPQFLDFVSGG